MTSSGQDEELDEIEFDESDEGEELEASEAQQFSNAVVSGTDWTIGTIADQLSRGNIDLNPRFQRRDAWSIHQKSRLIESLIVGLPVPQIVLAAVPPRRGKFLVLDGKQRLLTILQFWGLGSGKYNGFKLRGLEILDPTTFNGMSLKDFQKGAKYQDELNALENQSLRTVMIQSWPSNAFLHSVFLRLNTGSKRLSPQELRQALHPGPFTNWVDDAASNSSALKRLLGIKHPDYRMRDVELLARSLAFQRSIDSYGGRLKPFLDIQFKSFNDSWLTGMNNEVGDSANEEDVPDTPLKRELDLDMKGFDHALDALSKVFYTSGIARKPGSKSFNKAIFDALIYIALQPGVADKMTESIEPLRDRYTSLFDDEAFRKSVELDTASSASTALRIRRWGEAVADEIGSAVRVPSLAEVDDRYRINLRSTGEA